MQMRVFGCKCAVNAVLDAEYLFIAECSVSLLVRAIAGAVIIVGF